MSARCSTYSALEVKSASGNRFASYEEYPPMTDEFLELVKKAAKAPAEDDPAWETVDVLEW